MSEIPRCLKKINQNCDPNCPLYVELSQCLKIENTIRILKRAAGNDPVALGAPRQQRAQDFEAMKDMKMARIESRKNSCIR